jgi:hypothetical protein
MNAPDAKRRRATTQVLNAAELPSESLGNASAVALPGADVERLTVETKRRYLAAERRERTLSAHEQSTEAMQELLLLVQRWHSDKAIARLAIAQISESRRTDALTK